MLLVALLLAAAAPLVVVVFTTRQERSPLAPVRVSRITSEARLLARAWNVTSVVGMAHLRAGATLLVSPFAEQHDAAVKSAALPPWSVVEVPAVSCGGKVHFVGGFDP